MTYRSLSTCIARMFFALVITLACAVCAPRSTDGTTPPAGSPPPGAELPGLSEFKQRVDDYAALRAKLQGSLPVLPTQTTEEEVRAHTRALAQSIAAARTTAREGDLFVMEVRPVIQRICREVFTAADAEAVIAEIREESDELTFRAQVNNGYPDEAPLAWMPSGLLSRLPPLPEALRYRFLGNDLILLDEDARVIADVLRDVLPH